MKAGWPTAGRVALSLATRDAVARVAARRKRRSPGAGWSRVALRWRRRRVSVPRVVSGGTTIATQAYWSPQFHLHFNERTTRLMSRAVSDAPSLPAAHGRPRFGNRDVTFIRAKGVASLPRRLHLTAHALVNGQALPLRMQPAQTDEPWPVRRVHRSERPRDRVRGEPGRPGAATGIARHRTGRDAHLQRTGPATPMRLEVLQPLAQRMPSTGGTPAHASRLAGRAYGALTGLLPPIRTREALASRRPAARPADVFLPASPATPARVPQRLADLTWRTSSRAPAIAADRNAHGGGRVSAMTMPSAVQSPIHTTTVEARKDRPAVPSVTSADPRLLDRLTDEVIRRVERRIRIERERRGL